ncbi:MAG: NAD(P)/FAD-dependent oxidoreductase [Woeseiaceae bacterium]
MDRRTLLKLLAATAVAGCEQRRAESEDLRVVVAGAGIVGASIAYHLAKSGAAVTIIDKQAPASHASRGTFAWINATWAKQPRSYHQFSQASVAYWRKLHEELQLPVRWGGSLEWFSGDERQTRLASQIDEQISWEEPARMIDSLEFAELEPNVLFSNGWSAAYSQNDGTVDPVGATRALLAAAESMGAVVQYPSELISVKVENGNLVSVETSTGNLRADRVVLATGAAPDVIRNIADIDIPQRSTPGIIVVTQPLPRILNRIIAAPGVHMHQRNDGRVVIGEQDGAPGNEAHAMRLAGRPNDFPSSLIANEHASRMLAVAKQFAPALKDAVMEDAYIGWRPLPIDGHPVIGPSPARNDIYVAVMHSGVTLAPITGRLVADELVSGVRSEMLAPYRADRAFDRIKRY